MSGTAGGAGPTPDRAGVITSWVPRARCGRGLPGDGVAAVNREHGENATAGAIVQFNRVARARFAFYVDASVVAIQRKALAGAAVDDGHVGERAGAGDGCTAAEQAGDAYAE